MLLAISVAFLLLMPIATKYTLIINEATRITDTTGHGNPSVVGTAYFYRNGELVLVKKNNMTNVGDDSINDKLFNSSWAGATWNYIAIGTGDGTATNKTRTALVTETNRQLATFYKPADAQWGLNYTFTFASSVTILEAGILNAASTGTLAFYVWNLNLGLTSADTLLICWKGTTSGY